MPTQERAVKGEKNKKTTADPIPGKEKAKDRREASLPENQESGKTTDNKNKGKEESKKKD